MCSWGVMMGGEGGGGGGGEGQRWLCALAGRPCLGHPHHHLFGVLAAPVGFVMRVDVCVSLVRVALKDSKVDATTRAGCLLVGDLLDDDAPQSSSYPFSVHASVWWSRKHRGPLPPP